MSGPIGNGKNTPLNVGVGTVPNVGVAMTNWFQKLTFGVVEKVIAGFQVTETMVETSFRGVVQPLRSRDLALKPEGQRAWTWILLHSDPSLQLNVDDVVIYLGKQTRVMARKNFKIYGYLEYELVQDWTGAGPEAVSTDTVYDGGNAYTVLFDTNLDGGSATVTGTDIDGGNALAS